jgi:hypothetical protein
VGIGRFVVSGLLRGLLLLLRLRFLGDPSILVMFLRDDADEGLLPLLETAPFFTLLLRPSFREGLPSKTGIVFPAILCMSSPLS